MALYFRRDMGHVPAGSPPAGGGVLAAKSGRAVALGMQVVVPGLMVMAITYLMGTVSGAHLNRSVTLAFALRRNFPWRRVPGYVLAQLLGGVVVAQGSLDIDDSAKPDE
jgi:aquaporin Z